MWCLTIGALSSAFLRKRLLFMTAGVVTVLCVGIAQTDADGNGPRDYGKRSLHMMDYGYALPIEITAIRNFHRDHWLRDLEMEVKNISTKPIYEMYFSLFLPDDKNISGATYGVNLQYGRLELIHPRQRPALDDTPVLPGETILLKVNERLWSGYERHLVDKRWQEPWATTYDWHYSQ